MNSRVLETLQKLASPAELADGIGSFFKNHTARLRNILDAIITYTPDDPTVSADYTSLNGILVLSNDNNYARSVDLHELGYSLAQAADNLDEIDEVPIVVTNLQNLETATEYMEYDQVLSLIREQGDMADGLVLALSSYAEWMANPDLNFEQLTLERVNNLLPSTSTITEKLKQGITSIANRFTNSIRDYSGSVLHNILSLFGIAGQDYSTESVATYSGVNAWTVVLGDLIDGVTHVMSEVPSTIGRLFGTIGYAVTWLVFTGASKLAAGVEKAIISLTGANNAFASYALGGDKTVSASDWQYTIDYNDASLFGSAAYASLCETADALWNSRTYSEISIPLFAGEMNFQKINSYRTGLCLKIKPLNVTNINLAWNKTMNDSHLYYYLIQAQSGLISRNTQSHDYPANLTKDNLIAFFNELASNPDMYYLKSWKTDADAFMACQCGKIVAFLQLYLMLDDYPSPPGFVGGLLNCSALADFYIEDEYNYANDRIEPSNVNMLRYLASLKSRTTAFNNGAGDTNEYFPRTADSVSNLDMLWRLLDGLLVAVNDLDVLDENALTCFLPYRSSITYRKSSYYIPSDADNIDLVKGVIKTGLTVAAVAAVVLTGLYIRSTIKKKAFALEASAGSLSWNAAATGDSQGMDAAYKLSKRARLLGLVAGTSSVDIADAVGKTISYGSGPEVSLIDIRKLIKAY